MAYKTYFALTLSFLSLVGHAQSIIPQRCDYVIKPLTLSLTKQADGLLFNGNELMVVLSSQDHSRIQDPSDYDRVGWNQKITKEHVGVRFKAPAKATRGHYRKVNNQIVVSQSHPFFKVEISEVDFFTPTDTLMEASFNATAHKFSKDFSIKGDYVFYEMLGKNPKAKSEYIEVEYNVRKRCTYEFN